MKEFEFIKGTMSRTIIDIYRFRLHSFCSTACFMLVFYRTIGQFYRIWLKTSCWKSLWRIWYIDTSNRVSYERSDYEWSMVFDAQCYFAHFLFKTNLIPGSSPIYLLKLKSVCEELIFKNLMDLKSFSPQFHQVKDEFDLNFAIKCNDLLIHLLQSYLKA